MATIANRISRHQPMRLAVELQAALHHHRAGRLKQAATLYRKILSKAPRNFDALHLLGLLALGEGRTEGAIQLIGKAVVIQPDFAEAHSNLGNAQRAAGRLAEACDSYRRAIALQPNFALAHNNLGCVLCEEGEFADAMAACKRAVELAPDLAEAHNNFGNALRGLCRFTEAEAALRQAAALEPDYAARHVNLGNVLTDLKRFKEAAVCYRRAIELEPGSAVGHYGLASCLRFAGDLEGAVSSYEDAVAHSRTQPVVWNDLGRTLRDLGRFEEAVLAFRRSLAVDPRFAEAYRNLASCHQLTADAQTLVRLSALLENPDLPIEERAAAGFAMGKVLDDADRFEEAFLAYEKANRTYRDSRATVGERFDAVELHREIDKTIATFDPRYFASVLDWGSPSELPVFIVGMPRSGTSLVEQIAASHSRVFGAGELREIGNLAQQLAPIIAAIRSGSDEDAAETDAEHRIAIRRLSDAHLEHLKALNGRAERVIDKMPDNVFKLGAIATLFTGARVIFCRRDPLDTCLSCYFQKFTAGQLGFSYDLADCAKRYLETERLTAHWRKVLPLKWLDVEYEALVSDLEAQSRRIITFLGFDWEPACLEFHRTARTVTTASAWQVRQPLYDRAVGRWRKYQAHLEPLFDLLGADASG
jgi:tetratricopeptide (TPR) repeat protein